MTVVDPTLNAAVAGRAIMCSRFTRSFCLPNYTPLKWWECDVFECTEAGFFREYEIKLTVADFKADVEKVRRGFRAFGNGEWIEEPRKKHAEIGQPHGPTRFWYVTPAGLLSPTLIPEWAGLIELHNRGLSYRAVDQWREEEVRRAPKLHSTKADPKIMEHARGICYWRLHRLLSAR